MFGIDDRFSEQERSSCEPVTEKPGKATALRLEAVHRERVIAAPPGVGYVIDASTERAVAPGVDEVEDERSVNSDGRMEALGWLPRPVADRGYVFTLGSCRSERKGMPIAEKGVAAVGRSGDLYLDSFHGGIDVAHRSTRLAFFSENVPGLEGEANLDVQIPDLVVPEAGKAEFVVRVEPLRLESVTVIGEVGDDIVHVLLHKVREHPLVVDFGAPADERLVVGRSPEPRDESAQKKLLGEAHA